MLLFLPVEKLLRRITALTARFLGDVKYVQVAVLLLPKH